MKKENMETTATTLEKPIVNSDSNEIVTLTRGELQGIMSEIDSLKRGQRFEKPKRVTDRIAKLRFYEGKPVVWYGNVREIKDKLTGKLVAFFDIKVLDSDEVVTVEYLDFLNSPNSVQVAIKNQIAEKVVDNYGKINAVNPNPHFDKKWQGFEADQEVVTYRYVAEVEVLEGEHKGETYKLSSEALNR